MPQQSIAVVGSGISGLSAAWLLSKRHHVTVFERDARIGGHSNTVVVPEAAGDVPVDTGFIVYNTASYPNFIGFLDALGVATAPTEMSFGVSVDGGAFEYSGSGLGGLFAQRRNLVRPGHWRMTYDIARFFRIAACDLQSGRAGMEPLEAYLAARGFGGAFVERHILPMAAAIWSTPDRDVMAFPAASFLRFFAHHGLLQFANRPAWRTVAGGSKTYVARACEEISGNVRRGVEVVAIDRRNCGRGVTLTTDQGERLGFDHVVLAGHADDTLRLLDDASATERRLLGAFHYARNRAVLHRDAGLMPRRKKVWSSWNYLSGTHEAAAETTEDAALSVTYWMNRLQPLPTTENYFVTLNPPRTVAPEHTIAAFDYRHPMFDATAMRAQRKLWSLQGIRNTWFCGSYFGYGFHEDGCESGIAVAEQLGGLTRPWRVDVKRARVHVTAPRSAHSEAAARRTIPADTSHDRPLVEAAE